jgi:hypothetical protein
MHDRAWEKSIFKVRTSKTGEQTTKMKVKLTKCTPTLLAIGNEGTDPAGNTKKPGSRGPKMRDSSDGVSPPNSAKAVRVTKATSKEAGGRKAGVLIQGRGANVNGMARGKTAGGTDESLSIEEVEEWIRNDLKADLITFFASATSRLNIDSASQSQLKAALTVELESRMEILLNHFLRRRTRANGSDGDGSFGTLPEEMLEKKEGEDLKYRVRLICTKKRTDYPKHVTALPAGENELRIKVFEDGTLVIANLPGSGPAVIMKYVLNENVEGFLCSNP